MWQEGGIESGIEFFAEHGKGTITAAGISGCAAVSSKQNDAMAKITAFLRGKNGPELLFYLFRILTLGKPQPTADADAVGIADHTAGSAV